MASDDRTIKRLYAALAAKDGDAMAACYAPDARFSDGVFPDLKGAEVGAMWRMLAGRAQDLTVKVRDVEASGGFGSAVWEAHYTFAKTGRRVVNIGTAHFAFRDGLITTHKDDWSFHKWAGQALGPVGKALGWTKPFQVKVQDEARTNLAKFMAHDARQEPLVSP